jgi:addiction module HigA family antidote
MSNPLTKGLRPTHPGEILREDTLPALGRPKTEIARLLGISRRMLYDLLDEKSPITPQMALRIAKLTGTEAEHWLNLQQMYDLRVAEQELAAVLKQIPRLETRAA